MGDLTVKDETSLLAYMRSKTQVDLDSLSIELAKEMGPFADCTSNQADSYFAFLDDSRKDLLRDCVRDAQSLLQSFPKSLFSSLEDEKEEQITFEELGVEIAMTRLSLSLIPFITGRIFVMANPTVANSTPKTISCGRRIAAIAKHYQPDFPLDRLCIKIASTWEGLQASRILKAEFGINSLGTTLFTMEQAILAAEAGCIYISPFIHELRVHFDKTYHDKDPIFDSCVTMQKYYEHYGYATKVKACSVVNVEEVLKLAGVSAFTIAPHLLRELAAAKGAIERLWPASLFNDSAEAKVQIEEEKSFINNEVQWRDAYVKRDKGRGRLKTIQAITLFCEYQILAEGVIRDTAIELAI